MTFGLLATILGLVLLDMLSPTTMVVTIVIALAAGSRAPRLLQVYWGTVAAAYLLLGVLLMLGLGAVQAAVDEPALRWVQAVLGAGLIVCSFFFTDPPESDRQQWTPKALTPGSMVALGLGTWSVEAATAVPYFATVALLTSASVPMTQWLPALAAYCALMLVPCFVVLVLWQARGEQARERLQRWQTRTARGSRSALSWVVGIAGFLVLRDAVGHLFLSSGASG